MPDSPRVYMSIQLNQGMLPAGVTLLCFSLVIYKLLGAGSSAAIFVSGLLAGVALVLISAYI
jgi:hypothetical protein